MATYSPRNVGSVPGIIPMTFRAGAGERVNAIDENRSQRPAAPGVIVNGSPPSICAATAGDTTRLTRAGVVSVDIVTAYGRATRGSLTVTIVRAPEYRARIGLGFRISGVRMASSTALPATRSGAIRVVVSDRSPPYTTCTLSTGIARPEAGKFVM